MNRVEVNQMKRVRRLANNFVNKRMKLGTEIYTRSKFYKLTNCKTAFLESIPSAASLQSFSSSYKDVNNTLNDIIPSLNGSVSEGDEGDDFEKEIASWVVNSKIGAMHVDSLLRIIKKKVPEMPVTCRTLLNTPKNAYENIIPMCNGNYLHIGLQNMLTMFLSKHKIGSKKLVIDVGIDGTPSTNSSDTELWPIMINVVGFDEVLLVGSYFGPGKPKDDNKSSEEFLKPFVTETLEIFETGGITYENDIYELHFRAFVMDAPARAFIMNTMLYTGYQSCTKCIIDGIRIANRTVFHGVGYMPRTNFTFRSRIHNDHHHSNDITMIERLPIDCVKNVPIDSMHNVFLGVTKQLLLLWIHNRKKPYSISAKNIRVLSQRIFDIAKQMPSEFSREPRILKHLKRYKATEFRQFALYTLPIILEDLLPLQYYDHFLKFHCAIRILCTPGECVQKNALANELLTDFVKEFGVLYGYHNLSHNVHSLLHLSEDVIYFNCPLDGFSAFKFENFLQYLKKLARNNYRVLEQIHNRFFEKIFVSDYHGDFKKQIKKNKTDQFGNFTDIHIYNMHLSVNSPNNYVLIDIDCVSKIEKILQNYDGSFNIRVNILKHISPYYLKPIHSNLLNIFKSDSNAKCKEYSTIRVSKKLHKVAKVELNEKYLYLALLH